MRTIARLFFVSTIVPLVRLLYRVRRSGVEHFPRSGGVLALGNHVSYIDSFIVYLSCPRRVRFVVMEKYTRARWVGWFLRLFDAIPIRPTRPREAIERTVAALQEGTVVCLFPEGGLTRLGVPGEFKKGFEVIARRAGCPVVPFYIDGLWQSIFSFGRGRYFKKRPESATCPLQVAFGRPIDPGQATAARVRGEVLELSVKAFSMRREFDQPLEIELVRSLKKRRRRPLFVEHGRKGVRSWSRAQTLAVAVSLARRWMRRPPDRDHRIGILLPSGPMTAAVNLGIFLAGKTPVNLPFTIGEEETEALARTVDRIGIRTVITSRAFMPHLMDFWCSDEGAFIDLKSAVASGPATALFERVCARLEPAWLTCWRLDLKRRDRDREAAGMVPGADSPPVFLSSAELARNARQVTSAHFVQKDEILLCEDSPATPQGLVLGCWSMILARGTVVSRSLSLRKSFDALETAVLDEGVTLLAGAAEFYAGLDQPLSVHPLRYGLVFGAVETGELEDWERRLDLPLARGWCFAGRVATLSRPDPEDPSAPEAHAQRGRHPKSVGRPLPGVAVKVERGRLLVRFSVEGEGADGGAGWLAGPAGAGVDDDGLLIFEGAGGGAEA